MRNKRLFKLLVKMQAMVRGLLFRTHFKRRDRNTGNNLITNMRIVTI